jgi:hypothetical protein
MLDASLYPTLGACASSQSSHVFRLGDSLINRTYEVESFLGQMVVLSRQDCLAALNGLGQRHMLAEGAYPWFRNREGLGKEALHTASPGEVAGKVGVIFNVPESIGPALFILIVQIGIPPQQAPHLLGHLTVLWLDLVCPQQCGAAPQGINSRIEPLPDQRCIKRNHCVQVS